MKKYSFISVIFILFFNCQHQMDKPISTADQLKTKEGQSSLVQGKLLSSDTMKRIPARLQLQDSSLVYIGSFASNASVDFSNLDSFSDKEVIIKGIPYFETIPDKYKIISRLNGPYLVDIQDISEAKK